MLATKGLITGIVDWDDLGVGCRATDLAGLLFDWHRLRLVGKEMPAPDGGDRERTSAALNDVNRPDPCATN